MSGAHPLWPDYVPPPQHSTTMARASSSGPLSSTTTSAFRTTISPSSGTEQTPAATVTAASSSRMPLPAATSTTSTSSPSSSSFRRMVNNLRSTPSSPSSSSFHHASSSSSSSITARNASLDLPERRSMRKSLDRSRLQATASAAAFLGFPSSTQNAPIPTSSTSSLAYNLTSRDLEPTHAHSPSNDLIPSLRQHTLHDTPSRVQEPLPTSSFPSSSSSFRISSRKSPSHSTAAPSATTFAPTSSSSSSSSSFLQRHKSSASVSTDTFSFDAASSTLLTYSSSSNMRSSTASLAPVALTPAFSTHRNPGLSRLRSGSVSSYAASRKSIAGDAQVSIGVHIWWPSTIKTSSSTLARAPLFRDAANVKQKLSKRPGSSQSRAAEPAHDAMFGFRNHGPSWLREKPSKGRLNAPTASIGPQGQWKRATLLFRDAGSLSILDETNALSHSLDCGALYVSDVRFVHDSLFARPYVLMIQPRQSRARTEVSITTRKQEAALLQERARSSEPIFIECKSEQEAHYVRTLLHIYVKPEIFGSPATVDTGGSHRFFRQLDITISDAQSIMPKWPADLADSASDSSATPSMSPRPPAPMPPPLPASPTSATVLELPRSLSHQLASLRSEDQEDSPGSEPLTDDTLSGSSRAGSRPSSRQRHHNASTSSLRASRDPEKQSRSPAASRPTSRYDASFQKGIDAASSSSVHISGPLSGDSGASRFDRNPAPSLDETAPSLQTSVAGGSGRGATSRAAAALRREDKDRFEKTRFERYCRIRLDGDLVARTSLAHSSGNAFAVDKFQLKDVGDVKSLFIEVLHPTLRTSSALSGTPAHSSTKFMMLGIVEIPIETLRRNEEIEGRFPIWSISTFSHYTAANEDDGKTPTGFHRGVVGELSLSIHLHEGAILPLTMYEEVYNRLHDEDAHQMLRHLFTLISDDVVVSHVVRICAASGTITSRISTLIEEESVNWGEKMEPELLFRANTSLSRSVDHFQRLLALSWLEACLGPTVRKICNDAQPRSDAAASSSSSSTTAGPTAGGGGGGGSDDGPFDFSTSIRAAPTLPANAIDAIPDGPMTANSLRKLSETMWQNIYSQRHSCPADLRTVLHRIRRKVNECYRDAKSTRPGIQGVGAFVFLRLFCAALNAPQLYGLTPSQPGRDAQRKLLLLSKVLLALASKKNAFDREKDWELIPLNDFLRTYSSAYDDYISVVSTEPPTQTAVQLLGMRIEGDSDLQAAAQRKLGSLCTLHREAIPRAPYMLDQPQALASFVALVADAVEERELAGVTQQPISTIDASSTVDSRDGSAQTEAAKIKQKADEFIAICCRIEEAAGMCIELAGYDPRPIPFERLQRSALSSLPRYGRGPDDATLGPSPSRIAQGDAAVPLSPRDASLGSSPARSRSRRATVGAALALPKLAATKEFHPDGSSEQPVPVPVSPREAREDRRKSVGTPRSNQHRVSQVVTDSPEYRVTAGADPLARRESEANKKSNVQHVTAQSLGTSGTFDVATPSSYRTRSSRLIEDEDDHGSDVELREAYRKLRAEEEAGVSTSQRVAAPGLPAISTTEGPLPRSAAAGNGKAQPSRTPEALDALMEAEDGSTFEPVYAPRTLPRTVGSRASFSGKLIPVRRPALDRPSAPEPNRRHSSEEPEAPRNFSLPRPSADRNSAAIREREESSDGFEMAIEDAYAQTRATLPPSASMPVNMTGLAPVGDGRYGKEFGSGTDGAGKKKKWWKP